MATTGSNGDPDEPDGRRTTAQPLTASWRLDSSSFLYDRRELAAEEARHRQPRHRLPRGFGWLVYAIPVLVLVTILVIADTADHGGTSAALSTRRPAPTPVVTEAPVPPIDTQSGTAVLPPGPAVPEMGAGTWHVVPGNGPIVGHGPHVYRYQVAVEDGIDPALYGGDDAFAAIVDATLDDPRSWVGAGTISLQRVDASYPNPDFVISLTTPDTDHRPDLCGQVIPFEASCWQPKAHRVIINLARWVRGALAFDGDLGLYRQYAINHEVGHVLGNPHVGCAANGGLAPVMMQQSFGVSDDYVHELNQVDPANRDAVPADGKVCRPNAWPFPLGAGNPADQPPG